MPGDLTNTAAGPKPRQLQLADRRLDARAAGRAVPTFDFTPLQAVVYLDRCLLALGPPSKILPDVTSVYCAKLYAQARRVFGFHLRLQARARTVSRRS